jgi:hypothetical protein
LFREERLPIMQLSANDQNFTVLLVAAGSPSIMREAESGASSVEGFEYIDTMLVKP